MSGLRDARRALAGGAQDEALVYLWNELEPVRVAGDRRGLAAIARMATQIAETGDEGQRRDATRLLEAVAEAEATAAEEEVLATVGLDAGVGHGDVYAPQPPQPVPQWLPEPGAERLPGEEPMRGEEPVAVEEGEEQEKRPRLASLLWAAIVIGVILLNILRDAFDRS